jgi:hypothetical protein
VQRSHANALSHHDAAEHDPGDAHADGKDRDPEPRSARHAVRGAGLLLLRARLQHNKSRRAVGMVHERHQALHR